MSFNESEFESFSRKIGDYHALAEVLDGVSYDIKQGAAILTLRNGKTTLPPDAEKALLNAYEQIKRKPGQSLKSASIVINTPKPNKYQLHL